MNGVNRNKGTKVPFSGVCVVVQVFGELWLACVVLCLCVVPIDYRRPQVIRCDK